LATFARGTSALLFYDDTATDIHAQAMSIAAHHKFIAHCVAILLSLILIYGASSGPALLYAVRHRMVPGSSYAGFKPQPGQPWASERFYQTVRKFYEPMWQVGEAIGLEKCINSYLGAWNVSAIKVAGGHNVCEGVPRKTSRW
jgi:hypothetical protein